MIVYIINLDSRQDRWQSVIHQAQLLNFQFVRISAVDSSPSKTDSNPYLADGVFAIWKSHQRALNQFLATSDSHCMILEDDFLLAKGYSLNKICEYIESDFDFIQIGFLKFGVLDRLDLSTKNASDFFFKFLHKISLIIPGANFNSRLFISSQRGIKINLVLANIRPGAHAYVVSRRMAEALLEINSPPFLSTDLLYMALGEMRSFRMVRTRRSLVRQSNSKSSVIDRFKN
jgi:GR25 family glycosyltransferase involved in LPS biosynthesis